MSGIQQAGPRKATRIAGLSYILVILIGIIKVNLIEPAIRTPGDVDPGSQILANEPLFRAGIACEVLMYLLVVVLSLALYAIVKPFGKELARSALFFRFGEAMIGIITVIMSGLIPLLILNSDPALDKNQLDVLIESFLNVRVAGMNIVLVFIGVGGSIYCYLFFRSRIVPGILAAWGLLTYVSMLLLGFLNIILPARPDMVETVLFSLGGLFEVIFGFWLLLKGINNEKWINLAA